MDPFRSKIMGPNSRLSVNNSRQLENQLTNRTRATGLGVVFANFADARMSMQPIPSFSMLLDQAIQFDLMKKSMDSSDSSSTVAFMASSPHSQSGSIPKASSRPQNNSGGNTLINASRPHDLRSVVSQQSPALFW